MTYLEIEHTKFRQQMRDVKKNSGHFHLSARGEVEAYHSAVELGDQLLLYEVKPIYSQERRTEF